MSNRGKGQIQRDAEQRLSKIEAKLGKGAGKTVTIIVHDFGNSDRPPTPDHYTEDGTRIRIISSPEDIAEYMRQKALEEEEEGK